MYVIFPLDDLLDLNSARKSKRETAPSSTLNHKRHTVEGLPPSQPNHQLQPPLFNQQSTPNTPNPKPPQQQQQQQQPKPQKLTSPQKTPSIASNSQANTPISSGQTASSVPSGSSNSSSHTTSAVKHHPQLPPAVQRTQQQPEQLTQRQQSSYSTSTESSSLSSPGAKAKVLLSPQSAVGGGGKTVTNRYSWGGSPTATLQEPSVSRSSSFKQPAKPPLPPHPSASDNKDNNSTLIADDNKVIKLNNLNISNSVRGSGGNVQIVSGESVIKSPPGPQSQNVRPKLVKSESFRSHLSAGGAGAFRPPHHQQQQQYQQQQQHQQQQLQQQQQQQHQQQQLLESEGHRQLVQQHELSLQVTNPAQGSPSQQRQPSGGRSTHSSGSLKTSDISFPSGSAARPKNIGESIKPQGVAGAPPRGVHKGAMASEVNLRDLTHPGVNEALKAHNSVTFKLVKTESDDGM